MFFVGVVVVVTIIVTLPANFRLADITCYCWLHPRRHHLATARRCHTFLLWLCSFLAFVHVRCIAAAAAAVFVAHLSALWHLTCFNLCTTTFHYFSYFIQAPAVVLLRILLRFTCCVRCLRTATAAAAVSCHGFRKSISRRRQIIATFLAASLSPIIPTIIQATSV